VALLWGSGSLAKITNEHEVIQSVNQALNTSLHSFDNWKSDCIQTGRCSIIEFDYYLSEQGSGNCKQVACGSMGIIVNTFIIDLERELGSQYIARNFTTIDSTVVIINVHIQSDISSGCDYNNTEIESKLSGLESKNYSSILNYTTQFIGNDTSGLYPIVTCPLVTIYKSSRSNNVIRGLRIIGAEVWTLSLILDCEFVNTTVYTQKSAIFNSTFRNSVLIFKKRTDSNFIVVSGCVFDMKSLDIRSLEFILFYDSQIFLSTYNTLLSLSKDVRIINSTLIFRGNNLIEEVNEMIIYGSVIKCDTTFTSNSSYPLFVISYSNDVLLYNTIISNCYHGRPVLRIEQVRDVDIKRLVVSNNSNTKTSGIVQFFNIRSLGIIDSMFEKNTASSAGAIYLDHVSSFFMSNVEFLDNESETNGGALLLEGREEFVPPLMFISQSVFTGNVAGNSGGAMLIGESQLSLTDTQFILNNAKGNGGAIATSGSTVIENSVFKSNTGQSGGAIYSTGVLKIRYVEHFTKL